MHFPLSSLMALVLFASAVPLPASRPARSPVS